MNTKLATDSKTHPDPATIASELAEIEARIETAQSDEAAAEVELRELEATADQSAAAAYLEGRIVKNDPKVDGLRTRLRAIRSAKIQLMARRDLLEAEGQAATIDSLIASANRLNAERQKDYETALALQAVSARLFARSLGDLGGNYPLHGRIGRCGIIVDADGAPAPYLTELARISNELRAHGFSDAEGVCRIRASAMPGGQQLLNSPIVGAVRSLAHRIEVGLVAGEMLPANYERINQDVPANID
jgi:hypothetical protein